MNKLEGELQADYLRKKIWDFTLEQNGMFTSLDFFKLYQELVEIGYSSVDIHNMLEHLDITIEMIEGKHGNEMTLYTHLYNLLK